MIVQVVVSIVWKPGFIWTLKLNSFLFYSKFFLPIHLNFCFKFQAFFCYYRALRIAPCKVKQDSLGFWIPDSNPYRGPPDSLSRIPNSKAQESGFHTQNFLGFRNPHGLNHCCFSWCSPFFLNEGKTNSSHLFRWQGGLQDNTWYRLNLFPWLINSKESL